LAIVVVFGLVSTAEAQSEVVLHSFTSGSDGTYPPAGVVLDREGNFYGTTVYGGASTACQGGCGTVFKVDPRGNETILHSFTGVPDGENPLARLVLDREGNLYGTTSGGGAYGYGTVFKVDKKNNETVLHSFSGIPDGDYPYDNGGLGIDSEGNLYGTTVYGGTVCAAGIVIGCGTVFKVDPSGSETILYRFEYQGTGSEERTASSAGVTGKYDDGYGPESGIVLDREGNLYGTTQYGALGAGTVFKVDANGNETVLYGFTGSPDIYGFPRAGVTLGRDGNLYGTTPIGGIYDYGNVFKLDPSGLLTVLHDFSGPPDGTFTGVGVVLDREGNLYGSASQGGAYGYGIVFKLDPTGVETILHTFTNTPDGANPGAVTLREDNLYGTTSGGGAFGYGTLFELRLRRRFFDARDPQVLPLMH